MPVITGGVYLVRDQVIQLPAGDQRQVHAERRPIVVLSAPMNSDPDWPVVLACPISKSTKLRTEFDVVLHAGEGGCTAKCWVRVPALQPFKKSDLGDRTGSLDSQKMIEIQTRLLQYLGLIAR